MNIKIILLCKSSQTWKVLYHIYDHLYDILKMLALSVDFSAIELLVSIPLKRIMDSKA